MAHLVGRYAFRPPALEPVEAAAAGEPALPDVIAHPEVPAEVIPPSGRERVIDLVGIGILGVILAVAMVATYMVAGLMVIFVGVVLVTGVLLLLHARPRLPHLPRRDAGPVFPPAARV